MAFHVWWDRHDGMRGHVWLQNSQMQALRAEMLAQGMVHGDQGGLGMPLTKFETAENWFVSPLEIDEALQRASRDPQVIEDVRLWQDWLGFLEGASQHGGVRIKP